MTPRRNRPRDDRGPHRRSEAEAPALPDLVIGAPPGWQARAVAPANARKEYRCPGCNHEIRPGTGHVVAWRAGEEADRRHWHRYCWEREARDLRGR